MPPTTCFAHLGSCDDNSVAPRLYNGPTVRQSSMRAQVHCERFSPDDDGGKQTMRSFETSPAAGVSAAPPRMTPQTEEELTPSSPPPAP